MLKLYPNLLLQASLALAVALAVDWVVVLGVVVLVVLVVLVVVLGVVVLVVSEKAGVMAATPAVMAIAERITEMRFICLTSPVVNNCKFCTLIIPFGLR